MQVKPCNNLESWDAWMVASSNHQSFPQAAPWGDILLREGKRVERLQVFDGETVVAAAQVVYSRLPLGWQYAFVPQGPVFSRECEAFQAVYLALADYLKQQKCLFVRVEPKQVVPTISYQVIKSVDINPHATTILTVQKSEEELLSQMHTKTRYNIRLALKKEIASSVEKDFSSFWKLMEVTGERDGFRLHEKKHYEEILMSPFSRQVTVHAGGTPVAVGIFIGYGDTYTYLYGASDYAYRQLMAPYLIQWLGIQAARTGGFRYYDTFGIAPVTRKDDEWEYDDKHQYAGVTRFKLGFGGDPIEHPGTYDIVLAPFQYRLYETLRAVRRLV